MQPSRNYPVSDGGNLAVSLMWSLSARRSVRRHGRAEIAGGGTWHDVFIFGGLVTAVFIVIVWLLLPESVAYLDRRRNPGSLQAINRILTRFGLSR